MSFVKSEHLSLVCDVFCVILSICLLPGMCFVDGFERQKADAFCSGTCLVGLCGMGTNA
jgi:hypothetical protein